MRRKFLANPAAGGGRVGRELPELATAVQKRYGVFDCTVARDAAHLRDETVAALRAGYEQIVAVGGDGTVHNIVNAWLRDSKAIAPSCRLAIAPIGGGCDTFRGYSGGAKWLDLLKNHRPRCVDVGWTEALGEKRFFVNAASVGLGAEVVKAREKMSPKLPSALAYGIPTATSLWSARPWHVTLECDGETIEEEALVCFLAKGRFVGGGMKVGGLAAFDDGTLDVTLVRALGLTRLLRRLPKLWTGDFSNDEAFVKRRPRTGKISASPNQRYECDGELMGKSEFSFGVLPRALVLCAP